MNKELNLASSRQRYSLAKECPCGKSNKDGKFSPDKDNPNCGYCHSCQKTFFPETEKPTPAPQVEEPKAISFLSADLMQKSLSAYEKNNFIKFVKKLFPKTDIEAKAKLWGIGTSKKWDGANIFYQIDQNQRIRNGKIMLYNPEDGKRRKDGNFFTWVHSVMKLADFNFERCLFGLHLITDNKPIAVVESEKTAFLMALVDDSYNWVATASKSNYNYETLLPIKDFQIVAFPDKDAFDSWAEISERLNSYGFNISVSDTIEKSDLPVGTDLADLLIDNLTKPTEKPAEKPTAEITDLKIIEIGEKMEDLEGLAELLIPLQDSRTEKDLVNGLYELEGLTKTDAVNLIKVMRFRGIIEKTSINTYYLTSSTPF